VDVGGAQVVVVMMVVMSVCAVLVGVRLFVVVMVVIRIEQLRAEEVHGEADDGDREGLPEGDRLRLDEPTRGLPEHQDRDDP
jgi:hypothetical protein